MELLKKYELGVNWVRVKNMARSKNQSAFRSFESGESYVNSIKAIANSRDFLCYTGNFSIIQSIELENTILSFRNIYRWYDIFGERKMIEISDYHKILEERNNEKIEKYKTFTNKLLDDYVKSILHAIDARLESYVDPCYVDGGYVSPNSDNENTIVL